MKIELIYSSNDYALKDKIQTWLINEGVAELRGESTNMVVFHVLRDVVCETSIIILSEAAIRDEHWQHIVRELADDVRVIPISEERNYNNRDKIPKKIGDINWIRNDEQVLVNLKESLFTDPVFFDVKNNLLTMEYAWRNSFENAEYLLKESKQIRRYAKMIEKQLGFEKDADIISNLQDIHYFLKKSWRSFVYRTVRKTIRILTIGLTSAAIAVFVYLAIVFGPYVPHLLQQQRMLAGGFHQGLEQTSAVMLLNAGSNNLALLLTDYEIRRDISFLLAEYLDTHWEHAELGFHYLHAQNDSVFSGDTDFIWSANGDGAVTKWNRVSAQIEEHIPMSERPLNWMAITPDESTIVVTDFDSRLFIAQRSIESETWAVQEISHQLPGVSMIDITADGSMLAIAHGQDIHIIDTENFLVIAEESFAEVQYLGGLNDAFSMIKEDGQIYYVEMDANGVSLKLEIPIVPLNFNAVAAQNGKVALVSMDNELVVWNKNEPDKVNQTGQILFRPRCVTFINEFSLAFNDLNVGVFVYDFDAGILIERIFTSTPAVRDLASKDNQILGRTGRSIISQDLNRMLPLRSIEHLSIIVEHRTNYDFNENGFLREAQTLENGMVVMRAVTDENIEYYIIIDGNANILSGSLQRDYDFWNSLPYNSLVSRAPLVHFAGRPTVIGLLDDYGSMFIASSNGVFHELGYQEDGRSSITSRFTIPSFSPIVAVHQTANGYYLEDAMGLYWFTRQAYNQSWDELVDEVRDRIVRAEPRTLLDSLTPDLIKRLGLQEMPGGDGEVWE